MTFAIYSDAACTSSPTAVAKANPDADGTGVKSVESAALAVGSYGYKASLVGDANYNVTDDTGCEPVKVNKGTLVITTTPHTAAHTAITSAGVPLGSKVHDVAFVSGEVAGFPKANAVTFAFYTDAACTSYPTAVAKASPDADGTGVKSVESAALAAGGYGYKASLVGDANYDVRDDTGCEAVKINKAELHLTTKVHDPSHTDITNSSIVAGSVVHDFASVTGEVTGFPKTTSVTFKFYTNGVCSGTGSTVANAGAEGTGVKSANTSALAAGAYAFLASLAGDANYTVTDDTGCEPFGIFAAGKTQGFWGNTNGIARIIAAGGYLTNTVDIGRGGVIDDATEAAKILPNTGNACGKGNPLIFTGAGAPTLTKDCTASTNIGTLNTAASQTLALGYNLLMVATFKGHTMAQFQCAVPSGISGLTSTTTVDDLLGIARGLITNTYYPSGPTTQAQLGALNTLLGCVNKEA